MSPPRILITGAGGAAAVSFLRAVAGSGFHLFAADVDPYAVGLYLVPVECRLLLPGGDDPFYAAVLLQVCERYRIDVLVPTVDCELPIVAELASALAKRGTRVLVAPPKVLAQCLDKAELMAVAQGLIPVPQWAIVDRSFLPENWRHPVVVKPRRGSGGRGVRVLHGVADWVGVPRDGTLLAQRYLPGDEYSVDVLADADGLVVQAVPRARLKVDSGVAVASRTVRHSVLESAASALVVALGIPWVSNVQFRFDQRGIPRLLEVNPRFPGTMALTVAAGVNMPLWCLETLLGRCPDDPLPFRELAMVRHWEEVYVDVSDFSAVCVGVA